MDYFSVNIDLWIWTIIMLGMTVRVWRKLITVSDTSICGSSVVPLDTDYVIDRETDEKLLQTQC